MAKLVLKGHATRGKEVINLLEDLGAHRLGYKDTFVGFYYYIECGAIMSSDEYPVYSKIFTLEEFEKKYPYKVGDEVLVTYFEGVWKIIEILWSESLDIIHYGISNGKSKELVRVEDLKSFNEFRLNDNFKGQNKEEKTFPPYMDYDVKSNKEQEDITEPKELLIGFIKDNNGDWVINTHKDYEIKEVDGKFKLVKKQPKYLKTYDECCDALYRNSRHDECYEVCLQGHPIQTFARLLICRNAYWKIAGEEMGLGKAWEPDWGNLSTNHEFIKINKGCFTYSSRVLVFPTEEMRDAFYENFKDDIEQCKELL